MLRLLLLVLAVTVTPSQDTTNLRLQYEGSADWICIQTYGKTDDRMNPGDFLDWWAESCWNPYWKIEYYPLRPGALRYQICEKSDDGCLGFKHLRPEEEGIGLIVGPDNPPYGTK